MIYQKIDIKQNTPEWVSFRKTKLGASEVGIVMNLSPYQGPLSLAESKLSDVVIEDESKKELFALGHLAEDAGREWVKSELGLNLVPEVLVSTIYPDLMASLDGRDESKHVCFEAKLLKKEELENLKQGVILDHHMAQVQAQLLISGDEENIYFGMDKSGNSAFKRVTPDKVWFEKIVETSTKFMSDLKQGILPEPGDMDFYDPKDHRFKELFDLDTKIKLLQAEKDQLEEYLLDRYRQTRIRSNGVSITRYESKGSIDYAKFIKSNNIAEQDLEKFRKPGSIKTTIRFSKKGE